MESVLAGRIQSLDAGDDLATVSRLLGHERLETTAIYTQPTAYDLEEAVRRLERDPEVACAPDAVLHA